MLGSGCECANEGTYYGDGNVRVGAGCARCEKRCHFGMALFFSFN